MKPGLFKKSSKYGYCKYCGERLSYKRINLSFSTIDGSPIKVEHQLVCKNNNGVNLIKHVNRDYIIHEFTTDFNLQSPSLEDFLLFDSDKCTNWDGNLITKEMYELRVDNRGEK